MTLTPGTRLNTYEIIGPLGAGGMGEVYRALDTKLGRQVALKLVLDIFIGDRDREARFEREAKALAALNHPNIATLLGLEHAEGRHFLVMELVEGETLGERIARHPGGLPLDDALQIARQIAEALEAAHEKGVVHRDLKPANVKITPDDKVKVLDFGLAKVAERDGGAGMSPSMSPTISALGTQAGMIMGTASYMSPEQARGYTADHRSDVFAFGIVLYEMLTGRQPFPGETISDVLASVLARDPDLAALPGDLSPRLIDLVKRCLEKNPKKRWQAIGDVRYELEALMPNPRAVAPAPAAQVVHVRPTFWQRALPIAASVIATALIVAAAAWAARPAPVPLPITQFTIEPPEGKILAAGGLITLAISPDGSRIAYATGRQIHLRLLASLDAPTVLPSEAKGVVYNLAFAPDGQSLVYSVAGDIFRVPTTGGAPVPVHSLGVVPLGITWTGDSLIFANMRKVMRVSVNGGEAETLMELPEGERPFRPQLLPDGRTVLYTSVPEAPGGAPAGLAGSIAAQRIGEATRTVLLKSGSDARFVPPGHLVFARQGVLYATRFDPSSLAVSGDPVPVIAGVRRSAALAQLALASNGTLVYVPGSVEASTTAGRSLVYVAPAGTREFLPTPPGDYNEPRMSPDRRYIAFVNTEQEIPSIWIYDVRSGGAPRRLTFAGKERAPVWSPDSTYVTFQSERGGTTAIHRQRADGRGVAEQLTNPAPGTTHTPHAWSPDGKILAFDVKEKDAYSLMLLRAADKSVTPFGGVQSSSPSAAVFSPDGRWIAYSRDAVNANCQVFVQPFPATGALFQISKSDEDAHHQIWSADGRHLVYTPGNVPQLISVPLTLAPDFTPGVAVTLARPFTNLSPGLGRPYDTGPEGKIVAVTSADRAAAEATQAGSAAPRSAEIRVVLNWIEELRAKVPIK